MEEPAGTGRSDSERGPERDSEGVGGAGEQGEGWRRGAAAGSCDGALRALMRGGVLAGLRAAGQAVGPLLPADSDGSGSDDL